MLDEQMFNITYHNIKRTKNGLYMQNEIWTANRTQQRLNEVQGYILQNNAYKAEDQLVESEVLAKDQCVKHCQILLHK